MLSATSFFKADSDRQKYEKARQLKSKIVSIRKDYEAVSACPLSPTFIYYLLFCDSSCSLMSSRDGRALT